MKQVLLGKSSLRASQLAYGCWRIAGTWNPADVTPAFEADGRRAVMAAYDSGYTLFVHADIYCHGRAEIVFGQVLREVPNQADLWQRIRKREMTTLGQVTIKPSISNNEAGIEVQFHE